MKNLKNLLIIALFFTSAIVLGQTKITGIVVDETGEPLPGSSIVVKGTNNGAATDFDGKFMLNAKSNSGVVTISFVNYTNKDVAFTSATSNLGTIKLEPSNTLEEVVVIGKGVIDLAGGRKTSVAVSTIKAAEIQKKIGTQDVTMTLVNTPSVYVAGQSGGFGDSRIAVRGFEQDNTAYLLNGQPINGMEDGKMYWSNWSGINDIASAIQIQRGLGASKLAISSVGGTTNFVTKTTAKNEGGYFYGGVANDSYFKSTIFYNTGKSESGFATSVMLSHWQGDGYNEGTKGQGQTYFISFGYTPNEKHNFNFLLTGAPQWHDQNFTKSISSYLEHGRKYNNNWGTYNGEYMTERRNFYHKPVANLNWDFKISENSNLSTVLYGSWGRGGGTGGRGNRERTSDGYIDYDAIYAKNALISDGVGVNFGNDTYITRASMNQHSWFGAVSNFQTQLNDNLSFNIGVDLRTYYGEHFRVVENFHGLTSWRENIRLRDQNDNHGTFGSFGTYKFVQTSESLDANPWDALTANFDQKDKIAYSNDERISYGGVFTQLEYSNGFLSAFFQGALSNQYHQRFDHYQYADATLIDGSSPQSSGTPLPAGITDGVDSEKVENLGYNIKAGLGLQVDENSKFYLNGGFYSRQPYHDNIYLNFTNFVNPLTSNEDITSIEMGYSYSSSDFTANINAYSTLWENRVVSSSRIVNDVVQLTTNQGVGQRHNGIELDFRAKLLNDNLTFKGFGSFGDWKYIGQAVTRVTDEEQNVISTSSEDIEGGEVGDAAQTTIGFGLDYKILENLSVDFDWRYYDALFADVGAVKENLRLPSYDIADFGISYKINLGGESNKSLDLRANVNNVFNEVYISDLRTNIQGSGNTWKGINVDNQGYFGLGRTWNASVRYSF